MAYKKRFSSCNFVVFVNPSFFLALLFSNASRRFLRLGIATKLVYSKHLWLQLSAAGHQVIFSRPSPIRIFVPYCKYAKLEDQRNLWFAFLLDVSKVFELFKRKPKDFTLTRSKLPSVKAASVMRNQALAHASSVGQGHRCCPRSKSHRHM